MWCHGSVSSNRDCQNVLNVTQDLAGQSDSFRQFEGGVKLGIGSFNLVGFHQGSFLYHFAIFQNCLYRPVGLHGELRRFWWSEVKGQGHNSRIRILIMKKFDTSFCAARLNMCVSPTSTLEASHSTESSSELLLITAPCDQALSITAYILWFWTDIGGNCNLTAEWTHSSRDVAFQLHLKSQIEELICAKHSDAHRSKNNFAHYLTLWNKSSWQVWEQVKEGWMDGCVSEGGEGIDDHFLFWSIFCQN